MVRNGKVFLGERELGALKQAELPLKNTASLANPATQTYARTGSLKRSAKAFEPETSRTLKRARVAEDRPTSTLTETSKPIKRAKAAAGKTNSRLIIKEATSKKPRNEKVLFRGKNVETIPEDYLAQQPYSTEVVEHLAKGFKKHLNKNDALRECKVYKIFDIDTGSTMKYGETEKGTYVRGPKAGQLKRPIKQIEDAGKRGDKGRYGYEEVQSFGSKRKAKTFEKESVEKAQPVDSNTCPWNKEPWSTHHKRRKNDVRKRLRKTFFGYFYNECNSKF